jgi:hypothetical protein
MPPFPRLALMRVADFAVSYAFCVFYLQYRKKKSESQK